MRHLASWGRWISPRRSNKEHTQSASFADLGISQTVVRALARRDITEPFPVQQMVIRDALAGHDLLVQSPTGSGKTLAFGIPLVELLEPGAGGTSALVLAPTRELAGPDRRRAALDRRRPQASGSPPSTAASASARRSRPRRRADILVATPGRLEDLIDRGVVSLEQVRDPRPRRGRPDARHGLQARRRPDRRPDPGASARRCSSRRRSRARPASSPPPTPATPRRHTQAPHGARRAPTSSTASSTSTPRAPSSTTWSPQLRGDERRPHAGLRPHQARRRPAGQAAAQPASSRPSRCTATRASASANGRWPASSAATSTP